VGALTDSTIDLVHHADGSSCDRRTIAALSPWTQPTTASRTALWAVAASAAPPTAEPTVAPTTTPPKVPLSTSIACVIVSDGWRAHTAATSCVCKKMRKLTAAEQIAVTTVFRPCYEVGALEV